MRSVICVWFYVSMLLIRCSSQQRKRSTCVLTVRKRKQGREGQRCCDAAVGCSGSQFCFQSQMCVRASDGPPVPPGKLIDERRSCSLKIRKRSTVWAQRKTSTPPQILEPRGRRPRPELQCLPKREAAVSQGVGGFCSCHVWYVDKSERRTSRLRMWATHDPEVHHKDMESKPTAKATSCGCNYVAPLPTFLQEQWKKRWRKADGTWDDWAGLSDVNNKKRNPTEQLQKCGGVQFHTAAVDLLPWRSHSFRVSFVFTFSFLFFWRRRHWRSQEWKSTNTLLLSWVRLRWTLFEYFFFFTFSSYFCAQMSALSCLTLEQRAL